MLLTSVALIMLAEFQWMELLMAMEGGTSFCSINETLNCSAVWSSDFAKSVQKSTVLPLAGWGLVYGLMAFGVTLWAAGLRFWDRPASASTWAARLVGVVGVATSVVLLGVSANIGTFCITCVATYTLVLVFCGLTFKLPPPEPFSAVGAGKVIVPVASMLVGFFLVLLYPGSKTPAELKTHLPSKPPVASDPPPAKPAPTKPAPAPQHPPANAGSPAASPAAPPAASTSAPNGKLAAFLKSLPAPVQQGLSDALHAHKLAPIPGGPTPGPRTKVSDSKLKIVDFSDVLCGHCRRLNEVMHLLREQFGPQAFSEEVRWFPLDGRCNPKLDPRMQSGQGERCVGAKLMICLEDHPNYEKARGMVFAGQQSLTIEGLYEIASRETGRSRAQLQSCVESAKTNVKLQEDISYAWKYKPEGTPLLVINGRPAAPVPPFLYAIVLAGGDLNAREFLTLPKPNPPKHPGHGH